MKLHRAAIVAGAALVAAACSGDDPVVAPETTVAVTTTIATPETTAAPITTTTVAVTVPTVDDVPESLAFSSNRDVGRLFEADGAVQLFDNPGGDGSGALEDGRLVRASAAQSRDDVLFVGIVDPDDPGVALGWVEAQDLRPTSQFVLSSDPSLANQLGAAISSSGQDTIEVAAQPGGSATVATLQNRESVFFVGNSALAADGQVWVEISRGASATPIGWIPSRNYADVRSTSARDGSFDDTARRPDNEVTYGAPLPTVAVGATGCNAVQIQLDNPSSSLGMAFVLGSEVPSAIVGASRESWSGSSLFVAPGASTTITLPSANTATWFFAALDADFEAEANRTAQGELVGEAGSRAVATNVQEVTVPAGACGFVPPAPVPAPSDDLPTAEDLAAEEEAAAADGELGEVDGEPGEADGAEGQVAQDGALVDPNATPATDTTDTTVAPATATIPPTTEAVVVPPADTAADAQG